MTDNDLPTNLQERTESHYQAHPFDFMTADDERNIDQIQPAPFLRFVDVFVSAGEAVAEIGCGPGRGTLFMVRRGLNVTALDLSTSSIELARRRAPAATFVHGSNLNLPFASESFDAVISDGVIHHTPNPRLSFQENARILKSGGHIYVGVYRRNRYYYYIYNWLGPSIRWLEKTAWTRWIVNGILFPVYYLVHLVKSRGTRTWNGAKNFFYDYIITPQATFHTREEIQTWGHEERLELIEYHEKVGNVHAFIFRKVAQ
jgi:ubiquinone/menaquinone biosynthesis C-methylase UbiE